MEYKNNKTANRRRYKSRYKSAHNYKTKRTKAQNRAAVLVGVATFLVLAALVLMFTFGDSIYAFLDKTFSPKISDLELTLSTLPADVATQPETEAPTESETAAPTEAKAQDEEFSRLITAAGVDLSTSNASQMIFVETNQTNATVYTYERGEDGVWTQKFEPAAGFTGEGGAAQTVGPTDNTTPMGTYNIEYAMGTNADPGTKLTYYQIVYGMRWITDPNSVNYNRLVDGDATVIDWDSCQWLHEYTRSYPYAVVFDYNRNPVDKTQGCARFLHVGYAPTYGGVGIAESNLRDILLWLDPEAFPTISIF